MRHILAYFVILFMVIGFMVYKLFETLYNLSLTLTRSDEELLNHQLNIFKIKRYLLVKLKF